MDERVSQLGPGFADSGGSDRAERRVAGPRRAIDASRNAAGVDFAALSRGLAERLDEILDERAAARRDDAWTQAHEQAVRAWSDLVAKGVVDDGVELRRQALSTTVLRMGSNGAVDVVETPDHASDEPPAAPAKAIDAPARTSEDDRENDREDDRGDDRGDDREAAMPSRAASTTEVEASAAADSRAARPVDQRLRAARQRLQMRQAAAVQDQRRPVRFWRRIDARAWLQRLLVGGAIVAASALVSLLVT